MFFWIYVSTGTFVSIRISAVRVDPVRLWRSMADSAIWLLISQQSPTPAFYHVVISPRFLHVWLIFHHVRRICRRCNSSSFSPRFSQRGDFLHVWVLLVKWYTGCLTMMFPSKYCLAKTGSGIKQLIPKPFIRFTFISNADCSNEKGKLSVSRNESWRGWRLLNCETFSFIRISFLNNHNSLSNVSGAWGFSAPNYLKPAAPGHSWTDFGDFGPKSDHTLPFWKE